MYILIAEIDLKNGDKIQASTVDTAHWLDTTHVAFWFLFPIRLIKLSCNNSVAFSRYSIESWVVILFPWNIDFEEV